MNNQDQNNTASASEQDTAELAMASFISNAANLPVPAITDRRIIQLQYKAHPKTKLKVAENAYIAVPQHITGDNITASLETLMPHFVAFLEKAENDLVKAHHIAKTVRLSDSSFDIAHIVQFLEASGVAGIKLSGKVITEWFDIAGSKALKELLCAKWGVAQDSKSIGGAYRPDEAQQIALDTMMQSFKAKFVSLAGGATYLEEGDRTQLLKVLNAAEAIGSYEVGVKLITRITGMKKKQEEALEEL